MSLVHTLLHHTDRKLPILLQTMLGPVAMTHLLHGEIIHLKSVIHGVLGTLQFMIFALAHRMDKIKNLKGDPKEF